MRRRVVVVVFAALPALGACAAVLGLREIDEGQEGGTSSATDGGVDGARLDGGPGVTDAVADAPLDAGRTGVCSRYPTALLCDDFEIGDAASPLWRTEFMGGGGHVGPRPEPTDAGPYPNLQDFTVGFSPLPEVGKAALAFDGLPTGRRSLRFSLWIPSDAYPARVPIGGVLDATSIGVVVAIADPPDGGNDGRELVVSDTRDAGGSSPLDLGYVLYRTWTCVELELDGTKLRAWQRKFVASGTISTATASSASTGEIGLTWTFGGGQSSNSMHYDDVVIATGAVGCD